MSNFDGYAGDVDVSAAFKVLSDQDNSALVDVRTRAEWSFVGVPDLRPIGKESVFVEWQSFPPAPPVKDFVGELAAIFSQKKLDQKASIYFLCRSGARSQSAAIAMTQAGFAHCYNVLGGFEGPIDEDGHRGTMSGWKAAGLPWIQT